MSHLPLRFALRYLFARKSHNVINIISGISVAGMAVGTAALVIILSVFNGFNKLVSDSLTDAQPDLIVRPASGKAFIPDSTAFDWLYRQESVYNMSSVIEEQAFISYDGKQSLARIKGVDSVFEEESPLQEHITDGVFSLHRGTMPRAVVGSSLAWAMDISPRFIAPLEIYYPDREGNVSLSNPMASLRSTKVTVSGLFALNAELDAELVIVPIETMRELMDYDREVSAVEIRLAPGISEKEGGKLLRELESRLGPECVVLDRYRQNEALYKMMRYEKLAIFMIL
ncbi:MAG: ABC transporter permease, partial [Bacteroidales bacterium]|nr:ABC transporter permease [Bacteroidales bacterium]